MSEKTTKQKKYSSRPRRAVIVGGVRSPFVKAFGPYLTMDTITLATAVVKALLEKYPLPQGSIDSLVWGGVILPSACPNTAREIVIDANLPRSTEAFTVSRACASGLQAITTAAMAIERGDADIVIAGGSDSTSNAEIQLPQKLVHELAPLAFGKAKPSDLIGSLARLNFAKDVLPRAPKIAERSTGQTMGEAAEDMARRNEISREAQDNLAFESHQRAANAVTTGRFDDEVVPIQCQNGEWVHQDQLIRASTTREKLSKLRSAFAKNGSLTAGNSSPLTDGASATLLMSEEKAESLGLTPKAAILDWAYVGVDPADQLLMGPALSIPKVLAKSGLELGDVSLVDIHEAFASQVLSVVKMLASDSFAQKRLGRKQAVGQIGPAKLNVHGGSIAIGHPFAATGSRMVNTMANELALGQGEFAVLGICAAGGLGASALLQRL